MTKTLIRFHNGEVCFSTDTFELPLVSFQIKNTNLMAKKLNELNNEDFHHFEAKQDDCNEYICKRMNDFIEDKLNHRLHFPRYNFIEFSLVDGGNLQYDNGTPYFKLSFSIADEWNTYYVMQKFGSHIVGDKQVEKFIAANWKGRSGRPQNSQMASLWLNKKFIKDNNIPVEQWAFVFVSLVALKEHCMIGKKFQKFAEEGIYDYCQSVADENSSFWLMPCDWRELWENDFEFDTLLNDTMMRIGWRWKDVNIFRLRFSGEYDEVSDGWEPNGCDDDYKPRMTNNDAERFVCWALDHNLSVDDVRDIVAGRKILYENGWLETA